MDGKEIILAPLAIDFEPAELSADFDQMRERLDAFMEPYRDMDDAALEGMSRKELSDQRAAINKLIKSVEDGRKAVKAEYDKPLKAFEAEVKALLEPAREAADQLKAHIDRKDEIKRKGYRDALESYYAEVAGILAEHLSFDEIFDPEWVKSEAKYKAAFDQICEKCRRLKNDWDALRKMDGNLFDAAEVERDLFRTFDLGGAIERDEQRRAEADRLAALKAERKQYEPEQPKPIVFEEVEPERMVRERRVFEVWLSEGEMEALRDWKNANCIGMSWKFPYGEKLEAVLRFSDGLEGGK